MTGIVRAVHEAVCAAMEIDPDAFGAKVVAATALGSDYATYTRRLKGTRATQWRTIEKWLRHWSREGGRPIRVSLCPATDSVVVTVDGVVPDSLRVDPETATDADLLHVTGNVLVPLLTLARRGKLSQEQAVRAGEALLQVDDTLRQRQRRTDDAT